MTAVGTIMSNDILKRRIVSEDMKFNKRHLENEEIILLSLLDDETGSISSASSLTQLMVLMTRITKIDHRALCIHILLNNITKSCENLFVRNGGYRLLKRWLIAAEDDDGVEELKMIVKLCKKLPFDVKAIKETEIGKVIKKLLKYKHDTLNTSSLTEEIKGLMAHWTAKANEVNASTHKNDELPEEAFASEFLQTLASKFKTVKEDLRDDTDPIIDEIKDEKIVAVVKKDKNKTAKNEENNQSNKTERLEESKSDSNAMKNKMAQDSKNNNVVKLSATPLVTSSSSSIISSIINSTVSNVSDNNNNSFLIQPVAMRERKATDMAESARKLLEQRAAKTLLSQANKNNHNDNDAMEVVDDNKNSVSITLKSALKKKTTTDKKEKKKVQWGDESGGSMREVYTIEVEKIKSSVANYKTHRDLVKKERQFEKETHLSK
eukprot:gene13376-17936_t